MTKRYPMTALDRQRWGRLTRLALDAAANPAGAAGDLASASRTACKACAPDSDSLRTVFSPLIRLAGMWPTMPDAARAENRTLLAQLARQAETAAKLPPWRPRRGTAAPDAAPVAAPTLPFRADIDG